MSGTQLLLWRKGTGPTPSVPTAKCLSHGWLSTGATPLPPYAKQGAEWKRWRLAGEEEWEGGTISFRAYSHSLEIFTSFRYLGHTRLVM